MTYLDPDLPVEVLKVRETTWDRTSVGYPGVAFDLVASKGTLKVTILEQRPNVRVKVTKRITNVQQFLKELS